jgi:long-chain fatty acid transport protein
MIFKKFVRTVFVSIGFVLPVLTHGQAFQVNFQGQKQQGMGLAGAALYQDGSSLFYNPGSVAFSNENSANVGFTPVFANILYVDSATQQGYRTNSPMGTPFHAYGLFQLKDSSALKLGLAVYTPFGSTVQWEDGWIGRFALTRLSLSSIFIQPTVSYRINKHVGLGGGFVVSTGSVNLQRDLPLQFENGDYASAELSGRALGFGFNIGLHINASEKLAIGLTYRSRINMKVSEGEAQFNVPEGVDDKFPDGTFSSSLPLPQVATLGLAYKFSDKFSAVLDVNYVGWKAYDTLAFDYAQNTESLEDTKSARNYKNIMAFRLGASYKVWKELTIRAGGGFGFTPVQSGYATPETPDANRFYGTVGLGYQFGEHFSVDASLFYTQLKRPDTNLETNLSGTFYTKAIAPGLSLIYKW